jgi:hypothetical protein
MPRDARRRRDETLARAGRVQLVAMGGLAACGDDDESQATAEENLCASLEAFSVALANVQGVELLNPDANQTNTSINRVRAAWSGVEASAKDVQEADGRRAGLPGRRPGERGPGPSVRIDPGPDPAGLPAAGRGRPERLQQMYTALSAPPRTCEGSPGGRRIGLNPGSRAGAPGDGPRRRRAGIASRESRTARRSFPAPPPGVRGCAAATLPDSVRDVGPAPRPRDRREAPPCARC